MRYLVLLNWLNALLPCVILSEQMKIDDQTDMSNAALRRTIYLTIMSSAAFEECAHKIMKIKMSPGDEVSIFAFFKYV